jgi:hypothetical protein
LKLVRTGVEVYMYIAKDDAELKKIANTELSFRNPVLVGLAVCSHQADASAIALFSNVSVEAQEPPAQSTIAGSGSSLLGRQRASPSVTTKAGGLIDVSLPHPDVLRTRQRTGRPRYCRKSCN